MLDMLDALTVVYCNKLLPCNVILIVLFFRFKYLTVKAFGPSFKLFLQNYKK